MSSVSGFGFEIDWPDIAYDKGDQEFYRSLIAEDSYSIFKKKEMVDVFMYAMALGYDAKKPHPLEKRVPSLNPSAVGWEMRWLMRAVAVTHTQDLNIILDHKEVAKIAEQYANAGIRILRQMDKESISKLEKEEVFQSKLYDKIKEIGFGKEKNEDSNDEK